MHCERVLTLHTTTRQSISSSTLGALGILASWRAAFSSLRVHSCHSWLPCLVLLALIVLGCRDHVSTAPPPHRLRLLALGDSYTIGEAVAASERWPVQLAGTLRADGVDVGEPQIIAKTGWTTDELAAAINAANPPPRAGEYDLVSLLIGVNNQYRGRSVEEFREQFRQLLARAITFARGGGDARRVIVLSIPDWSVTPFARDRDRAKIAHEIDAFNDVCRDEAKRAGATFIDITPGSRRASDDASLVAPDGLHPSPAMYREWATAALPVAREVLGR